ncbi:MAG: peptidoglycan DD-metalloendopeptidase family protein [Melioribacteraceae bacterium]|nr:peptidoglycan DD-metalloendopeptidase family protein [Melioribacteraceae bacterium]MCF8265424.1 peptidoglycan DD-metalloendopeptidase family protein [Melioribacteraceae bacterium]MCF8413650.1 peptidoglycan DD-metalloendopeptidase family protein [Melioribacteraceae bacterium]MCF8432124.1 peptidoglycan DD-metalloendopeptidase family protein [Melioribacteraceae bacterium]
MKNFYYFSTNKLKFVEVHNFYKKFVFLTVFFSFLLSFFVFGAYFAIKEVLNPDAEVKALQAENHRLGKKLEDLLVNYQEFDNQIDELNELNNHLRIRANLEPIVGEERELGIGGSIFEEVNPSNSSEINDLVNEIDLYVGRINSKLDFELENYLEIENRLNENIELFESIPAVKPTAGPYGDEFGMRNHPILKIRRMHNGIDFLVNTGTKIWSSGNGKVVFAGRKGGLGITVEIDHGFGYKSIYGHLSKAMVKKGTTIKRGDLIALSGNSGRLSTGPHLHYEVRHNGIALNPRNFIYDDVSIFEIQNVQEN